MNGLKIDELVVAYPSGNTTAIVISDLPSVKREELNGLIGKAWRRKSANNQPIEQCGFLTRPLNSKAIGRLEMFGGEFCGNATRSAVWLLTGGKDCEGLIETSGSIRPLNFSVRDKLVTLEMPPPNVKETEQGSLVTFDGITQLVTFNKPTRKILKDLLARNWMGLSERPAVGITSYDKTTSKAEFSVWVKDLNTIFDETACGSGTAAIGAALAKQNRKNQTLEVLQPSGNVIQVQASGSNKRVANISIAGTVDILYKGKLQLK